jgi:uncharacterized protein (DUF1499 family)
MLLSNLSKIGFGVGAVALVWLALCGPGWQLGLWHFRTSFLFLRWGIVPLGALGFLISLVSLYVFWPGKNAAPGFGWAILGLAAGLIAAGIPLNQLRTVFSVPFIHDITTDTENPPKFVALHDVRMEPIYENGVDYAGAEIAEQQKKAYPDIQPVHFDLPKDTVFGAAMAAAKSSNWVIAASEPSEGRIEATQTTLWYGFKDDVVVRIADDPAGGTRLDVRSESRVGKSDLGVNARRIRQFVGKVKGRLAAKM